MFSDFKDFSNKTALFLEDSRQVSYKELDQKVGEIQKLLQPSELIFIIGSNDLETLVCYIAAIRQGTVALMLSPSLDRNYLKQLINNYNPKYVWAPNNFEFDFSYKLNKSFKSEKYFLLTSEVTSNLPNSLALLLTTSGSTGNPKLVRISKNNLESNTLSIIEVLDIDKDDSLITTLPINYSYGLSLINTHLQRGATVILNNHSVSSREFWEYARTSAATSMGGVPFTYELLIKFKSANIATTKLRKFTQAGGKLKKETALKVLDLVENLKGTFHIMYGQTEATARISVLPFHSIKERPESIGKPIPRGEILLIDEGGKEITQPFLEGTLVYKGPNVSLGHAENLDDLYLADSNCGYLDTGDLGHKDTEGYFYITGRKSRFVKIFGLRMNLDDIENSLTQENIQCACIQLNDTLIIFVVDSDKISVLQNTLKRKYNLRSTDYSLKIIASFPRSESGKILYGLLANEELNENIS